MRVRGGIHIIMSRDEVLFLHSMRNLYYWKDYYGRDNTRMTVDYIAGDPCEEWLLYRAEITRNGRRRHALVRAY